MRGLRRLLLLLVVVASFYSAAAAKPSHTVSIFVYDAGETLGLLPVAPLLEAEGVEVRWVPLTPWARRILEQEGRTFVPPPDGLEQMAHVKERAAGGDADYWLRLTTSHKPDLIILGLVSGMQEQLAREFRKRGLRTAGFYDGFDTTDRGSVVWRTASQVNEVWAPTEKIRRSLNALGLKKVKTLGQPTLETWHRLASKLKPAALYERLGVPAGKRLVVFAGQYGDGYEEILTAFLKAVVDELSKRDDLYLVLSPHPKTGGEVERAALLKHPHPRINVMPQGVTTAELAAASAAVITWRSTVGVQAAFLGRPVVYFNLNARDYRNELIDEGIAQAATPATFGAALQSALARRDDAADNRRRLSSLGYVLNSDRMIAAEVLRLLRKRPLPRPGE